VTGAVKAFRQHFDDQNRPGVVWYGRPFGLLRVRE